MKVKLGLLKITLLGASLAMLGFATPTSAAIANVAVGNGGLIFTPQITNIYAGDSVIWTWATGNHTVTSSNNVWTSTTVQSAGTSFTNTFNTPGTYGYYCGPHKNLGMVGEVVVAQAPTVVTVGSGGLLFTPKIVNIPTGGQIIWQWATGNHTVTSSNNAWTSTTVQSAGTSFTNTFNTPGTYGYYCGPHKNLGMVGEVVVGAVPQPPTVAITNPVAGEVFAEPASVTIQASTSDGSGTVTSVQFLVGTNVVAIGTSPPFAAVTNNLPAGNYSLFAIATDSNGLSATNQVAVSVVTPIVSSPGLPTLLAPHQLRFSFTGNTGLSYVFQSTTNLALPDWINLYTNQAVDGAIDYTDLDATLAGRYFRVERLSNP
jgi:plastocyanin